MKTDFPEEKKKRDRPHLNSIWPTRIEFDKPHQCVQVDVGNQQNLFIGVFPGSREAGFKFSISRKDAKLLARRIEQCLKATTKK